MLPPGRAGLSLLPGGGLLRHPGARRPAGEDEAAGDRGDRRAREGDTVLLARQGKGRREGMWRLPVREKADVAGLPLLHRRKYGITRYRVTLHVHGCGPGDPPAAAAAGESRVEIASLEELTIPPADRAALAALIGAREEIA